MKLGRNQKITNEIETGPTVEKIFSRRGTEERPNLCFDSVS